MISVLIVDDHEMVRLGVSTFLSVHKHIQVVGQASNGQEGIALAQALRPDVILMDLVMEPIDGILATQTILQQQPDVKIIIVTSFIDDEKVYPAIQSGACGYLLKTTPAPDIVRAIEQVYNGEKIYDASVLEKMNADKQPQKHDELTHRELEVLLLMAQGKSNQEISEELFIALKTVKTHVSNVLMKLEVDDRTQATIYAFKKGLIK
ncbi:response regulator transcription factor [Carnobacteriaceae bacterium zg-ZUI252]|nr:response regulator transcription factor [Carnobacteriaceae bacterium zg-ZUI252]